MRGWIVLWLVALPVVGQITAEHPSDLVRVLEAGPPGQWDEAVIELLGEKNELSRYAVASVSRRLSSLSPAVQIRAIEALSEHPFHRRALADLRRLVAESRDTRVRIAARTVIEEMEAERARAASSASESEHEVAAADTSSPDRLLRTLLLVLCALLALLMGLLLFTWAFRLLALASRIRHRPLSKAAALSLGPVALEGEVQPATEYLHHPVTGEACLYYAGADRDHPAARFFLVDESGRVLVDPRQAVLLSDDGVLVPGERVHLVGHAAAHGDGGVIIRKPAASPMLLGRLVHRLLDLLFGLGRPSTATKMLFTDPGRCYWIWDDLECRPLAELRDYGWLVAGVLLGGAWMVLFALAIVGLVDQEAPLALGPVLRS